MPKRRHRTTRHSSQPSAGLLVGACAARRAAALVALADPRKAAEVAEIIPRPVKFVVSPDSQVQRLAEQLYDADKKDMRMAVHVDDILRGLTSDFELNREEDCGDDVYQCYAKQYSGGVVVIPPGNHTVRIAWAGKGM